MKDLLRIFFVVFMVFAVVGFITGWDKREKTVKDKIYRQMVVIKKGEQYYFEVQSGDDFVYHYSIDDNSMEAEQESMATSKRYYYNSLGQASERNNEIVDKISAFIGPTAGLSVTVYSAVDLLKKPKAWAWSNAKRNIAMLLGSVSGYFAGEWVGRNIWTGIDSDLALKLLNDDLAMWEGFEKTRLVATLIELQTTDDAVIYGTRNIAMVGNDPIQLCNCDFGKRMEASLQYYLKFKGNCGSADFQKVDDFKTQLDRVSTTKTYMSINRLSTAHALALRGNGHYEELLGKMGYSPEIWEQTCEELCAEVAGVRLVVLKHQNPTKK